MLLDFPLPKRQSGIFTSNTRLPLPAPGCESHVSLENLGVSFLFICRIVFVEFPSRKHGIKGASTAEYFMEQNVQLLESELFQIANWMTSTIGARR
jgi:hypothetical protein